MFSMSSLLGFSLLHLSCLRLSEPDVVLSMSLVLSHVVSFVAEGIGVCFGLALVGGGTLHVMSVSFGAVHILCQKKLGGPDPPSPLVSQKSEIG